MILRSIVFAVLLFLIEFYFIKRTAKSVKTVFPGVIKFKYGTGLIFFLIFFNIYPAFLITVWTWAAFTHNRVPVPQNGFFDYLVIYPFWIYIFIALQCVLFFLLLDLLRLLFYPFSGKIKTKIKTYTSAAVLIIVSVFAVYVPSSVIYDYYNIQVRQINYSNTAVPEALDGFKIAFISDIHADRYTDGGRLSKYISLVNRQSPDLVLIGGDVISSSPENIPLAAEYLGDLKSRSGVYSCVGDHDYWAYGRDYAKSLHDVKTALLKKNIKMLDNKDTVLTVDGEKILITFLTNTYVEHINQGELNYLAGRTGSYGLKIIVIHQPSQAVVNKAVDTDYNLIFAGHTHGGQITFLFPFLTVTPTRLETRYIRGDFRFRNLLMVVTRGLGMSLVPMRYNSLPEISIINIRKSKNN